MGRVYSYFDNNGKKIIFAKRIYIGNNQMKMLFSDIQLPAVINTIHTDEQEELTFHQFILNYMECVTYDVVPGLAG